MISITNVTFLIDPGECTPTAASAITALFHTVTWIQTDLHTMPSALAVERFLTDRNAPIVSLQIDGAFAQLR